jgi:hypothetical protein
MEVTTTRLPSLHISTTTTAAAEITTTDQNPHLGPKSKSNFNANETIVNSRSLL